MCSCNESQSSDCQGSCGNCGDNCKCHNTETPSSDANVVCSDCNEEVDQVCDHCDTCAECCPCPVCSDCGNTVKEVCDNCDECESCCVCEECEDCSVRVSKTCECCCKCPDCCYCDTCNGCAERVEHTCSNCCQCESCCCCRFCNGCEDMIDEDDYCTHCERCESCCSCLVCENCGDHYQNEDHYWCGECDRCTECCCCSGEDNFEGLTTVNCEVKVNFQKHHADPVKNLNSKNRSKRLIGVEIETDSVNVDDTYDLARTCDNWGAQITKDGSTDGPEVVLAPASGHKFMDQVHEICAALKECDAKISKDCGLHVHTDGRDFNWYDLRRMIILYSIVEDALYGMCPTSRNPGGSQHDDYCKMIPPGLVTSVIRERRPSWSKMHIIQALYEDDTTQNKKNTKWGSARYYGLNLHSWLFRGTFEFRMPPGTSNEDKIINWGVIFASIVDFAYKTSEDDILDLRDRNPLMYGHDKHAASMKLLLCIVPAWVRPWIIERTNRFKKMENKMDHFEELLTNWDVYGDPNRGKMPLPVSNDYLIKQIMDYATEGPAAGKCLNPPKKQLMFDSLVDAMADAAVREVA